MKLILFFNGWGMDRGVVEKTELPEGYEIEIINYPYIVKNNLEKYDDIILIGWSFGCYYLTKYLFSTGKKFDKIIGINGNGEILGKYGISPKIFEYTINTLTSESLIKFYKNMEIDENFSYPQKSFENIKDELENFKKIYEPLENIFTKIIIGKNDKIVPSSRQKRYCVDKNINYEEIECGHYPFNYIKAWSEII